MNGSVVNVASGRVHLIQFPNMKLHVVADSLVNTVLSSHEGSEEVLTEPDQDADSLFSETTAFWSGCHVLLAWCQIPRQQLAQEKGQLVVWGSVASQGCLDQ